MAPASRALPFAAMPRRRVRPLRLGLWLGVLIGAAWFVKRYQRSRRELTTVETSARSPVEPEVRAPVARPEPEPAPAWVVPDPGGTCPSTHPIKAKLSSKLFHLPGMFAYARTNPDRCYRDEAAAESDGLRRAKR